MSRIELYGHLMPTTGGDTPLPKSIRGNYPKVEFAGLTLAEEQPDEATGGDGTTPKNPYVNVPMPMPMPVPGIKPKGMLPVAPVQPDRPQGDIRPVDLKNYPKMFKDRVTGKLNPFNVYGVFPETAEDVKQGFPAAAGTSAAYRPYGGVSPMGAMPGFDRDLGGPAPGRRPGYPMQPTPATSGGKDEKAATGLEALPEKLVIRFIDAGLEPGHSYQYFVRVRLKNPNHGKTKEVAFPAMAEKTHLESPWVLTPPVWMPFDYSFYFVNQSPLATHKTVKGKTTIDMAPAVPPDKIPVQIHQLTHDSTADDRKEVGDWVVAERLFLARGDLIARKGLEVEVPYWDAVANHFTMGTVKNVGTAKAPRYQQRKSIPVDFGDENSPVLVDFRGVRGGKNNLDEGNIEALVLLGDGRLVVRNSYEDADPESALGAERLHHYDAWRTRLESFRNAAAAGGPGGMPYPPGMPGKGP